MSILRDKMFNYAKTFPLITVSIQVQLAEYWVLVS